MEYLKKLFCICVAVSCLLLLLSLNLPDISPDRKLIHETRLRQVELGEFGKYMVSMLPDDLAFTIFTASDDAFERILKLRASESLLEEKMNDTFAILSRVMGFSTIPRHLPSEAVPVIKEISFDSVSGYRLYAWKAFNETLFINNVRSERVDMRKGETIVHVMTGVIMDPEFELLFETDDGD